MQSRLTLTDAQLSKVSAILDETRDQYRLFRDTHKAEMQAILDAQVRGIKAVLSPEQRQEYEKMREERQKRRHNKPQ
jgi:hypothetical protein